MVLRKADFALFGGKKAFYFLINFSAWSFIEIIIKIIKPSNINTQIHQSSAVGDFSIELPEW